MAVDWIGFGYAAAIVFGGFMGYKRKGTKFTFEYKVQVLNNLFYSYLYRKCDVIDGWFSFWRLVLLWSIQHHL